MDENFLNLLYENAKLKNKEIYQEEQMVIAVQLTETLQRVESYRISRAYAKNISASKLYKIATATLTTPHDIDGLSLPFVLRSNKDTLPVHMGLLIEAAYLGSYAAADRFDSLYRNDAIAAEYVSKQEIREMRAAMFLYRPDADADGDRLNARNRIDAGDELIVNNLVKELSAGINKNDADSFHALALVTLRWTGAERNIEKAYKLFSVAEMFEHPDAARCRRRLEKKHPELTKEIEIISRQNPVAALANQNQSDHVTNSKTSTVEVSKGSGNKTNINASNSERICIGMMKNTPYSTIISFPVEETAMDWLLSLPKDCHLLYEGKFERENNTVERYLRLMDSNGYPALAGEFCSAPPHVAIESIHIATYQL